MYHPKADIDQLYLPRNAEGWGLAQPETTYKATTTGMVMYLKDSEDALLYIVIEHDGRKKLFSIQKEAKKFTQELNLPNLDKRAHEPTAKFVKKSKTKGTTSGPRYSRKAEGR